MEIMQLVKVDKNDLSQYKADMQEAFQLGAVEGGFDVKGEIILSEGDIDRSLGKKNAIAYKAVADGEMIGGAIIVIEEGEKRGYLDFLYVKHGTQGRGIGKFIWFEIERMHPEVKVWETCTPYFEKRNIHFYMNVCGFHAVEFFNAHHPDPNMPEEDSEEDDFEMFEFRKVLNC